MARHAGLILRPLAKKWDYYYIRNLKKTHIKLQNAKKNKAFLALGSLTCNLPMFLGIFEVFFLNIYPVLKHSGSQTGSQGYQFIWFMFYLS